jgi:uncharacterized membrane protein
MNPNTETPRDTEAYMRGYQNGYDIGTSLNGYQWWTWVEVVIVLLTGTGVGFVLGGLVG